MQVDYLIIGQGLAGSALAIELLRREQRILVVDRQDKGASSRVAAGLITPLTGKGMNPAWRQREYLEIAKEYYHQLEQESGRKLFHPSPVVRVFQAEKERAKWESKRQDYDEWAFDTNEPDGALKKSGQGAIEMPDGAWLDTLAYLHVIQDRLVDAGAWREADFSEDEVTFPDDQVQWRGVTAKKIILCQGAYGLAGVYGYEGYFSHVPHRSAKGEILSVWIDGLDDGKRYHANGWLAPREGGVWKAGANYNWKDLDSMPTESGKNEVLDKLRSWVDSEKVPMEVIDHEAGIRPIIRNSRPVVGFHHEHPNLGFFNGLGSKGTLMAPAIAKHFAEYLCGNSELDSELSLGCFLEV
ncbi:MAG: NAD(P)/FAD-dependent oxidoreductase [Akkermansiaceae bacterium]